MNEPITTKIDSTILFAPIQKQGDIDKALANKWGCQARTIRTYRTLGAPLTESDQEMRDWLMKQPKVGAGTHAILVNTSGKKTLAPPKPKRKIRVSSINTEIAIVEKGAAANLRRLEASETAAYEAMTSALSDPDATTEEIIDSRKGWLAISEALRKSDLAIEQDRRASGELVSRSDIETYIKSFLINFCQSMQATLESSAPRLAGLPSAEVVWGTLGCVWKRGLIDAIEHTATRPIDGKTIPGYLINVINETIETYL